MSDIFKTADYGALLTELKTRTHSAQYAALRAINKELLAVKHHYTFDFLELADAHEEIELEANGLKPVEDSSLLEADKAKAMTGSPRCHILEGEQDRASN